MIPIESSVRSEHRLSVSEWRRISKLGWAAAGAFWHRVILPRHFTHRGARQYGYAKRSRRYELRKLRKYGHTRPLEYSGELKRQVLRMREVRTVGDNSKRAGAVRIKLRGPRHLYAYRKDLRQPDKAKELATVSRQDADEIAAHMDDVLTRELSGRGEPKEIRR